MLGPFLGSSPPSKSDSWLARVLENLAQLFAPAELSPSSANGAPIHVLKTPPVGAARQAQTVSLLTHAGVAAAIALFAVRGTPNNPAARRVLDVTHERLLFAPPSRVEVSDPSLGHRSGGGEESPTPATHGFLARRSSIQLAAPRLPDNLNHQLLVPVAILDAQAPPILTPVPELGLPWMPNDTNSAGPGKHHGIGSGNNGVMGDRDGSETGEGNSNSPHHNGISIPTCRRCPYPVYTDEARRVKMQGTVTLRVLVGADGHASDIRVVRGVGYGLDERAVQTVREWDFTPARDAVQHAVPAWVTIEAVFRLF